MPGMSLKTYIEAAASEEQQNGDKRTRTSSYNVKAYENPPARRDDRGRFIPGNTGGPGRPQGFPALIREMTCDGEELVMHALDIMRGEARVADLHWTRDNEAIPFDRTPSFGEQQAARNWLADRGFGKSIERIEVAQSLAAPEIDYSRLSLEQRIELERLMVLASPLMAVSEGPQVVEGELVAEVTE